MNPTETMKAAVYCGPGDLQLQLRPRPVLRHPLDAIVKVTLSTICTSDLHILNGAVPRAKPGTVLGHEFVGEVVAVGSGVRRLSPGDRVAANCITYCGECWYCRRGYINNCEHGGWELGCRIDGCQAEYVRVPFADQGLTPIPSSLSDQNALFVGDILASGYFGAQLCEIRPGDTVAVIGAGPVGLCSMQCARLFGAAQVVALDTDPIRLNIARSHSFCDYAVNPARESPVAAVQAVTDGRGADAVIEAAGGDNSFEIAWRIARPNAAVALVAMYEKDQTIPLPGMYGKNLTFKTGGVDAVHCPELMKLLERGRLQTDLLITHRTVLSDIRRAYDCFARREDGCLKWAIIPDTIGE
ncbi:MAG: alcohol dehydrogenase catalytic domain-containing protein [Clostridiales bacterium]|jgi:alcohol dehydrogenase|nr:alcohol dehydrogenase catalytic domain-containing protein [Clostridiales bacterium]